MTRLYEVNPANTAEIWDKDANERPFRLGGSGPWLLHNGRAPSSIRGAIPEWDIYESIEDNRNPDPYHVLDRVDLAFEGTVNSPAARVRETRVFVQISLDDLYERKQQELVAQDDLVLYNTADTSLHAQWWIVIVQKARNNQNLINGNWLTRKSNGQGWPGGVNAPRISVYKANTGDVRREQVTDAATWETVYEEVAVHGQVAGVATHDCGEAMEAAYNAADWAALAAITPSDGTWGYPPYRELSGQALAQLGG